MFLGFEIGQGICNALISKLFKASEHLVFKVSLKIFPPSVVVSLKCLISKNC